MKLKALDFDHIAVALYAVVMSQEFWVFLVPDNSITMKLGVATITIAHFAEDRNFDDHGMTVVDNGLIMWFRKSKLPTKTVNGFLEACNVKPEDGKDIIFSSSDENALKVFGSFSDLAARGEKLFKADADKANRMIKEVDDAEPL